MSRSAYHHDTLMRYASLWGDMGILSALALPQANAISGKEEINRKGPFLYWLSIKSFTQIFERFKWLWVGVNKGWITALFLVATSLIAYQLLTPTFMANGHANNVYTTRIGESRSFDLDDGSQLWLNTNSQVKVDYTSQSRRIVIDSGEAYFKVAKNPDRPFEVYAGSRMVRAVGTAFSVYRKKDAVEVTVTEGRVDLEAVKTTTSPKTVEVTDEGTDTFGSSGSSTGINVTNEADDQRELLGMLVAGQSIVLSGSSESMDKAITHDKKELARQLSWRDGLLVFEGETLEEVLQEVSRYTPIKIEIADKEIEGMRIGGQFQIGKMDALFDVLETGFGLQVSYLDKNVVKIQERK
jgi:transmembrane sensor